MRYALCVVLISIVPASANVIVYACDSNSLDPYPYNEIMVGQTISLIVASDSNDLWSGGMFLKGMNRQQAVLTGRGEDPNDPYNPDWSGSHFENAGTDAVVTAWVDSSIQGFDMYTDVASRSTGNWFVLDYTATAEGVCDIEFYQYHLTPDQLNDPNDPNELTSPFTTPDPNTVIQFAQIPTRDFNNDQSVNFEDFIYFSNDWNKSYPDPNNRPDTDIDRDGYVGLVDLGLFSDYWLWNLGTVAPPPPPPPVDPVVTYSIVADANGPAEIYMTPGESITLYMQQEILTTEQISFDLEVNISNSSLGFIDNDPNGSAEILISPRWSVFDHIGPGAVQPEGIRIMAVSDPNYTIGDELLASFEYTAQAAGDVELTLVNHLDIEAQIIPLTIHQSEPMQMSMDSTTMTMSMTAEEPSLQTSAETAALTTEEMVTELNELWEAGEISGIPESEWNEFIESVESSYSTEPTY